jgi:catechol 2,3-dioxygenase-like lactoylglutathione lyase family enzyme
MARRVVIASLVTMALVAGAPAAVAQVDPLKAASPVDPVAASPLREVTIAAADLASTKRFYQDAMGMTVERPVPLSTGAMRSLGVTAKSVVMRFIRAGDADAAGVRVVMVPAQRAELRPTYSALALGGLAMGMPVSGQAKREGIVKAAGFQSVVGVTSMVLPRSDGTNYTVEEIHYKAPDGVLVLGIDRGEMTPVGPIDVAKGIGGPAYASLVVADLPRTEAFMKVVLRYEKRRDAIFASSGPKGGLGLAAGQRFAFQQWFAPGSTTGYAILMKMLDRPSEPPSPASPVRRGIAMWTFDAVDLTDVADRAESVGMRIVARGPKSLILAMPDGFLVEFVQRPEAKR